MDSSLDRAQLVKNLERRWGLSLVSFLPRAAAVECVGIQKEISAWCSHLQEDNLREGRGFVEFQDCTQLHCTHLTMRRSDPRGPVLLGDLLKDDRGLAEVFDAIRGVTPRVEPIEVEFDRMVVRKDGLGIIALGRCLGNQSKTSRAVLIGQLVKTLEDICNLELRSWDKKNYASVHCALGFVKRPLECSRSLWNLKLAREVGIQCVFPDVTLVHHKHRTLLFPQEGLFTFPLGSDVQATRDQFVEALHLEE